MGRYRPEGFLDATGKLVTELAEQAPRGTRRRGPKRNRECDDSVSTALAMHTAAEVVR